MANTREIVLQLDCLDYDAIQAAMALRESFPVGPPDGEGNWYGALLAEICRGWMEMLNHQPPT